MATEKGNQLVAITAWSYSADPVLFKMKGAGLKKEIEVRKLEAHLRQVLACILMKAPGMVTIFFNRKIQQLFLLRRE